MADPQRFGGGVSSATLEPSAVEIDAPILNQIRIAVIEGLHKIPHGGLEIGGLLVGERRDGRVHISGWEPISCQHALGPSFSLSETDRAALADQIIAAGEAGREVVGWFHSHTRTDLTFTQKDRDLHEQHFPEPWQIALLLRPAMLQPTRAAFFARRPDGSLAIDGDPFELETPEKDAPGKRERHALEPVPAALAVAPAPAELSRPVTVIPMFQRQHWSGAWRGIIAALVVLVAGAALFAAWRLMGTRNTEPVALNLTDNGGQLRISWNPNAAALEGAREGKLVIQDGANVVEHGLNRDDLRRGSMAYLHSAEKLYVRLTVLKSGGRAAEEWSSFIGPARPPANEASRQRPSNVAPVAPKQTETPSKEADSALRDGEARIRSELERLEKARAKAEAEHAAYALSQAEREKALRRMEEQAKTELARLEQLRASIKVEAPAVPSQLPTVLPSQSPALSAPPPAPKMQPEPLAREPERPRYAGPSAGRVIWTGNLPKNGTLTIEDAHASLGAITGRLPRLPIRIRAYPAELSDRGITVYTAFAKHARGVQEAPSRENGWNQTTYRFDTERAIELSVLEPPSARNEWRKMALRAGRKLSMIVIEWDLLPGARR